MMLLNPLSSLVSKVLDKLVDWLVEIDDNIVIFEEEQNDFSIES